MRYVRANSAPRYVERKRKFRSCLAINLMSFIAEMSNQCRYAVLIGEKRGKKFPAFRTYVHARDVVDERYGERKQKFRSTATRRWEALFPLRHWVERKRRRTEIKRREERKRERGLKRRTERGERSARRSEREGNETKGEEEEEEEGIGELCLQYDRGLTRAKVARVTPSSY